MTDEEMILTVIALAGAYYYFIVRPKRAQGYQRGGLQGGRRRRGLTGGTVGGGASKNPATNANTTATNPQQRGTYTPRPVAAVPDLNNSSSNVGTGGRRGGIRSRQSSGIAGSFVAPQWPTKRITSTGAQTIGTGDVSVPSYAVIPLTRTGPGGGGSWTH